MPSQSVLKSKDYRQIIGFLTKVIDQTILHEQELNERFGDDAPASDAVILRGLRRKRDAAYRVLERMLELILVELGELEIEEIEPELPSESSDTLIHQVFPEDNESTKLKRELVLEMKRAANG
ncbi:hypothetical protein [Ponticaulis sp.]|uniref:hypothetical protein n=1 Tax=Ponticaulis sp. TaxID=2020902 RepID=UPI000B714864|nr:hypothetical protein [Ponticaulis sp.]MAI89297.1 hypothetical protein [Ponticaulis sp.]OUY01280.1 MAG: hypothetical protein CBB65_02280 [Hyphomonadaceae bacterium TMED5]|tara:strand:- start:28717 stop:29085 length:369 start_codon:yes stop_codon:yes gene_type:complete